MKYLVTIVLFMIFNNTNAQLQEILTQNDWYLYSLTIEGEEYMPPVNSEMPFVSLSFDDNLIDIELWTQACNTGFGYVTFDEDNETFSFVDGVFDVTLFLCDILENNIFDTQYYSFYLNNVANPYLTYITYIDDPNSNEELLSIEVISANGDSALYLNWLLSTVDFTTSEFKIFPNPVSNSFYIFSTFNKNMAVLIYDITGKLIITKNDIESQDAISIENLKAGVYFVHISDEQGNVTIERIVKN